MDYIASETCCCSFNPGLRDDDIRIETREGMISLDNERKIIIPQTPYMPFFPLDGFEKGKTYRCAEIWIILKNNLVLKMFGTKEECEKEYRSILDKIKGSNNVIII